MAVLSSLGYRVVLSPHALNNSVHSRQSDALRAQDFTAFYSDSAIDVLWCSRGGSSSCRLWPLIVWPQLSILPPKMLIGYSDITSLHLALSQQARVITMHGPMISELDVFSRKESLDWLLSLLATDAPLGACPARATQTLVSGIAEGRLCGGCLSLLAGAAGTPYQLNADNQILFLEDIDEAPHRIERYLVQMRESGTLATAAGFIVGEATLENGANSRHIMDNLWKEFLAPYGKPTVTGFPAGHVTPNYAIPLGVRARLDADERTLTLLEPAVQ